jgi:hypothetical protein
MATPLGRLAAVDWKASHMVDNEAALGDAVDPAEVGAAVMEEYSR